MYLLSWGRLLTPDYGCILCVNDQFQDITQSKLWVKLKIWLETTPIGHHIPSGGEGQGDRQKENKLTNQYII